MGEGSLVGSREGVGVTDGIGETLGEAFGAREGFGRMEEEGCGADDAVGDGVTEGLGEAVADGDGVMPVIVSPWAKTFDEIPKQMSVRTTVKTNRIKVG